MKRLLAILAVAVSCSASSDSYPEWRWPDPEGPDEPVTTEPNPSIVAQGWTNVTSSYASLPEGLAIYRSPDQLEGVKAIAYIAVVPLDKFGWDVWSIDDPENKGTDDALRTPAEVYGSNPSALIINGGYFFVSGSKRYNASVAVSGGRTYGVNLNYASQDWVTYYYPTRGVFWQKGDVLETGWTYYTTSGKHYLYSAPAENSWENDPLQAPDALFPVKASDFAPETAIGGGPVLIYDGRVVNSWKQEMFYGDGSDDKMPLARHPRTAIGVAPADGGGRSLILFVCEGRGMTEGVAGLNFEELAAVMESLGCTDALNLDGGGSSCMLVGGQETIKVSDGAERPVGSVVYIKVK